VGRRCSGRSPVRLVIDCWSMGISPGRLSLPASADTSGPRPCARRMVSARSVDHERARRRPGGYPWRPMTSPHGIIDLDAELSATDRAAATRSFGVQRQRSRTSPVYVEVWIGPFRGR
jgi:hypothetical protein